MFRFFTLNLDWNIKSLGGKCSKKALKLNKINENKIFFTNVFEY